MPPKDSDTSLLAMLSSWGCAQPDASEFGIREDTKGEMARVRNGCMLGVVLISPALKHFATRAAVHNIAF